MLAYWFYRGNVAVLMQFSADNFLGNEKNQS